MAKGTPVDRKGWLAGAAAGMFAWVCYGAVEFALTYDVPLIFDSKRLLSPWAWPLLARVFLGYAVLGAVGGTLAAVVAKGREIRQTLIRLTLGIGFAANLLRAMPVARSEYIALIVDGVLITALLLSLGSETWCKRLGGLTSPWALSLLLLAAPWISRELLHDESASMKLAVSGLGIAVVAVLAILLGRRSAEGWPARSLAAITAILLVSFLANRGLGNLPGAQAAPGVSKQPNVVLVILDAVRADHLSLYGYRRDTTPNLNELAKSSAIYRRAIATSDMTLSTHASMFTGLYASWHGAHYAPPEQPYGRPLDGRHPTLAGVLRSKGYSTIGVAANFAYLQPDLGIDRGFQIFDARTPVPVTDSERPFLMREGVRHLAGLFTATGAFDAVTRRADEINRDAMRLVDGSLRLGRPFFLFLNYMDAHTPYVPPAPYDRLFAGKNPRFEQADYLTLQKQMAAGRRAITNGERNHLESQYDGGIAFMDAAIGNLVGELKSRGAFENTIFVVAGDHGEAFGEQGLLEHSVASVYQTQVHVPLLIRLPGTKEPLVSDELVSQVDLMPTILEAAGYPVPDGVQGRSLLHPGREDRPVIAEAFPTPEIPRLERAIFLQNRKLIVSSSGRQEYFDLAQDPEEQRNQYGTDSPELTDMQAALSTWMKQIPKPAAPAGSLGGKALQRLKGLGYVQ